MRLSLHTTLLQVAAIAACLVCSTLLSGIAHAEGPARDWCLSGGATLADNRKEEASKTTAWRKATMVGRRYCTKGAALLDIEYQHELHGIAFMPPGSPGMVVCTYPFTKADIDAAEIGVTFVEASYTVREISGTRSATGAVSTGIHAECHTIRLYDGWEIVD
jgi:hypothetical protein